MDKVLLLFLLFWNVENFYDPYPSMQYNDTEYTAKGDKHWSYGRFAKKADDIAKTIAATAEDGSLPHIMTFAEVENRAVLEHLLNKTILKQYQNQYRIVHRDSPDLRGSDVALLYNINNYKLLNTQYYKIISPHNDTLATREILYARFTGVQNKEDTLHLFVNHWPSKRGGGKRSQGRREAASAILNRLADSVILRHPEHIVIACGDFNTSQPNVNFGNVDAKPVGTFEDLKVGGSYKYKGRWEMIDNCFIYSPYNSQKYSFADSGGRRDYSYELLLFNHPYLLLPDKKYLGLKPRRTYIGPIYQGGVSDHLPLVLKVCRETNNIINPQKTDYTADY